MSDIVCGRDRTAVARRSHRYDRSVLVGVLGPLRVERDDGSVVELRHRMQRRLLSALAARHPRAVTVDGLIDAMWGESPPPSARKTLQTNVFRLRKTLGATAIVTTTGGYRLGPSVRVDVDEFERLRELHWWRGDPFDELSNWSAIEGRRARLVELRCRAEDTAAESQLASDHPTDAVAELERLVVEDPLREHRWTLLVRALLATDRRADALQAYERARRTFAIELGISPGVELQAARQAALDAGPDESYRILHDDPIVVIDGLLEMASRLSRQGQTRAATEAYVRAADGARRAGDVRRFAEAALGAASDGVRVALDATDEVLSLVREALVRVPPGPTPTRSRLLARVSVLQSQHSTTVDNESAARAALAIARALDDPALVVGGLTALTLAVADPLRHDERAIWIEELGVLTHGQPDAAWIRWLQPLDARERVLAGDIDGAVDLFAQLDASATDDGDVVGQHAASYGHVLEASVGGDWDAARAAAARVRRTASVAMFDEATATIGERGMLAVIELLEGRASPTSSVGLEWPTPEMTAAAEAHTADGLARAGLLADAEGVLSRLCRLVPELARDGYWLATLSMVASAVSMTGHTAAAGLVADLLEPCIDLTVADPGLIYRGSAAHFAGLAASVLGRPGAADLLRHGWQVHQRHGAQWMAERSLVALRRTD